jgi:hypothetical protein
MSISSVPWTRSLGLSGINLLPLGYQEEYTPLLLVVKGRTAIVFTSSDKNKGDGRSLHCGLSAPPTASQAFVPGVAMEIPHVV